MMSLCPRNYSYCPSVIIWQSDEAVPRISVTDLEVSRHRISLFLSTHNAYELLPESGKIIALDVNLPVKQAFHILFEQGISVAPLWDFGKGQFVGVLSALDFILILKELGSHGSNLTEEELETHTIAAWKEGGKLHLTRTMDGNGASFSRRHLVHAGPNDCLKDVALKILQNKVATVPIIHFSLQDGSVPQLLHLASLSGILKCIYRYFRHSSSSLPILQQPICSIPCGTWVPKIGDSKPFAMLRPNASLSAALALLVQAGVSSIPIVDDNGSLLDIYSRSDITALAKDKVYAQIRLDEMSILEALRLGQDANSPHGVFNGQRCQMCLRSDPLHEVMKRLANPGVRRLIIVEAGSNRVEGIISLSDVFKFLLGYPEFVGHHFT
ncbi:sucrose nonfermenting 4-like protein isoform X3 [Quercus lobata]|uniref:sucrose nonfermenting 4-like protein isoform X2 n=1 Tax=Quercus lobata TaxID=97700 RepID=UPI001247357C|nr:sucrose nonfermenting 4-like protein isoform X2 [Quercus lobata]XP_030957797.1 sucrose nonfermenting 4-like protein isoform X3 [Quercus lobata]